jgi:hypothetical protein
VQLGDRREHAGGGVCGTAAGRRVHDRDAQPALGAPPRDGQAHHAAADDDQIGI